MKGKNVCTKHILLYGMLSVVMLLGFLLECNLNVQADQIGEYLVITGGKVGKDYTYQDNVLTIISDTPMTISANPSYSNGLDDEISYIYYGDDRILIAKDVSANLTIQDLDIEKGIDSGNTYETWSKDGGPAIQIADNSSGNVTITLKGDNVLSGYKGAAIQKNGTAGSLTITGTGELNAASYSDKVTNACAAIGGSANNSTGNIIIENGTIWANSYIGGAGIGGGYQGELDGLTINGGQIVSNGWRGGAGIGGGYKSSGKNITINGGVITAKANLYKGDSATRKTRGEGAGIGGGGAEASLTSSGNGDGVNITINGGTVTASCGTQADNYGGGAGIGGGFRSSGVNIQIKGGTVNATGGNYAAGIGGGGAGYNMSTTTSENSRPLTNSSTSVTITGGTITAQGTETGAGIGGGYGRSADVTISGGHILKASCTNKSSYYVGGAGIGGGGYYYKSDEFKRYGGAAGLSVNSVITITSGTIDSAIGGAGAAGVGEIYGREGKVYISGGSIQATAGAAYNNLNGASIGAGADKENLDIVKSATDSTVVTRQVVEGFTANKEVNFKVTDGNGATYSYGTMDVYADANGKLYLYLPEGSKVQEVSGNTWEGSFCVAPKLKNAIYKESGIQKVALYQSGKLKYEAAKLSDGTFQFNNQSYEKGNYDLYIDGENSGKTVIIGSVADGEQVVISYYEVTDTNPANATITYDNKVIRENGTCTFQITPEKGYRVSSVIYSMNGKSNEVTKDSNGNYTIPNVQGDVTITPIIVVDQIAVDLSNVTWKYNKPYYYDNKTTYTVELANVPTGVRVTYTGNSAKAVGKYTASATIVANDGYVITKEANLSDLEWSVEYYPTTDLTILYNGDSVKKDSYEEAPVLVYADGYQVSTSPTGSFNASYDFNETDTKTLHFRNRSTGYITDGVEVSVKINEADTTPPVASVMLDGKTYKTLQSTVAFKRYKIQSTSATVSATDNSGEVKVEYAISDNVLTSKEKVEAAKLTWTEGTTCKIATDQNQVVYVKATDKAGNVAYASTVGIYADTQAPVITKPGIALTSVDATNSVDINFTVDEACTYYYAVLPSTTNPSKADIVSKGTKGKVSQAQTVSATVNGLSAATAYRLYVYANDDVTTLLNVADGNESDITQSDSITTAKDTLIVDTVPVLSGVYGTAVTDMTISGGIVKCGTQEVKGTWKISDKNAADFPNVGSTNKYTLTFTPEETTLYNAITCDVVPKVTAKSLTDDMLTIVDGAVYTGSALMPAVTVQDGNAVLVKDADYTVVYANNVKAGDSATVTVTGKKNYTGSIIGNFTIAKATLTSIDKPVYVNVTVGSNTVISDLTELLPAMSAEDRAGITYSATVQSGNVVSGTPTIKDTMITIGLNGNATAGSEQKITVTMSSNNYTDMTAQLIVKVTAKTIVTLSDDVKAVDSVYDGTTKTGYTGTVSWNNDGSIVDIAASDVSIVYSGTTASGAVYGPTSEKPQQAGNYKISFSVDNAKYNGNKVLSFEIAKKSIDVSAVSLEQKYYVYTGKEITAVLKEASIPGEVTYTVSSNKATNVGSYQMVVSYQAKDSNNYEQPQSMTFNWMITKAVYDISNVTWDYSETFTYDGTRKTVQLKNLPEDVEAVYSNNSAVKTGKYTASAQLKFKDTAMANNYTLADVSELKWEIQEAQEETKAVTLYGVEAQNSIYEKNVHPEGYLGTPIWKAGEEVVDVTSTKILYAGRTFDGTVYETNTTAPTNAGNYTVTFVVEDENYTGVQSFDYTIDKASYDMSNVAWNYSGTAFNADGTTHSVEVFNLPTGVSAKYIDNTGIDAGNYTAKVSFVVKDSNNYNVPDSIEDCEWEIKELNENDKSKTQVMLSGVEGQDTTYAATTSHKGYSGNIVWKAGDKAVTVKATTVSYYGRSTEGTIYGPSTKAPTNAGSYVVSFTVVDDSYIGTGSVTYSIQKAGYSLSDVHWNYSGEAFAYDGKEHRVELAGLPKGITVSYTGNAATEVGIYLAKAECIAKDSANYTVSGTIEPLEYEIAKGIISVDQVTWNYNGEPFEYDGSEHSVLLQNIPGTVDVVYSGNVATDKGTYTAKATISAKDSVHYEVSETSKICKWSIIDKDDVQVTLSDDVKAAENLVYDGTAKAGYTGDIVWYEKGTTTKVEGIVTKIQYNGVNGTQYTSSVAPTNAGDYTVTFTATAQDGISIIPTTLTFTIQKAKFIMDGVKWNYSETAFEYDGMLHTVEVEGLPDGVSARYTNNSKTGIGTYTATVQFVVKDPKNYEIPSAIAACKWEIKAKKEADPTKKDYDMSAVKWNYSGTAFEYDGTEKEITLTGLPAGVTVTYTGNKGKEVGEYTARAQFAVDDPDTYNVPDSMVCSWAIIKATDPDNPNPDNPDPDNPTPDNPNPGTDKPSTDNSNSGTKDDGKKDSTSVGNEGTQTPVPVVGEVVTIGDNIYKIEDVSEGSKKVCFTGLTDKNVKVADIPDTVLINGISFEVVTIDNNAFKDCKKLKKVKLGKNITTIGNKAFYKCTALTSVVIPEKVTSIGKQAFFGAKKLKKITIKSKVLKKVGSKAIKGIYKKAVIKCPNKKLATQYKKKLFKAQTGYMKTMKIK